MASPALVLLSAVVGTMFLVQPSVPSSAFSKHRGYLFAQTAQWNRLSDVGDP